MLPPNWPSHIHYLSTCSYHSSVSKLHVTRKLARSSREVQSPRTLRNQHWLQFDVSPLPRIRRTASTAFLLLGCKKPRLRRLQLKNSRKIPARTHILDYIGQIHCDEREDSDYDLSLFRDGDLNIGIDARDEGNEARFINDYRGIQEKPNAIFVDVRATSGELRMRIESCKPIKKGEEIVVSYGKGWWQART